MIKPGTRDITIYKGSTFTDAFSVHKNGTPNTPWPTGTLAWTGQILDLSGTKLADITVTATATATDYNVTLKVTATVTVTMTAGKAKWFLNATRSEDGDVIPILIGEVFVKEKGA